MGDVCVGTIVSIMSFISSLTNFKFAHLALLLIGLIFSARWIFVAHCDVSFVSSFLFTPVVINESMEGCFNLWLCLVMDPGLIFGLFFVSLTTTALLLIPWVISLFVAFLGVLLVRLVLFLPGGLSVSLFLE